MDQCIKEHCCGTNDLFDLKTAQKELKKYKSKGVRGATKKLLSYLTKSNYKSILDIGGGIGALQWELLNDSNNIATHVDASNGYLKVSSEYADQLSLSSRRKTFFGDFVEIQDQIEQHELVVLDKVICCYPDFEGLLKAVILKSNKYIAFTFPIDGHIATFIRNLSVLYFKFKKTSYRPYIHSEDKIHQLMINQGMERMYKSTKFPWNIWVYKFENNA